MKLPEDILPIGRLKNFYLECPQSAGIQLLLPLLNKSISFLEHRINCRAHARGVNIFKSRIRG